MAWTFEIDTERNIYPNLTVCKKFNNGVQSGWQVTPNEGYVMYIANAEDFEPDPETGNLVPVVYYYRLASLPQTYNWNNFSWTAILESEVDGNYIFGGGDEPEHEIM